MFQESEIIFEHAVVIIALYKERKKQVQNKTKQTSRKQSVKLAFVGILLLQSKYNFCLETSVLFVQKYDRKDITCRKL